MGEHYLFIMHSFGGGAEVVTLTLARQLQNKGDVVRVVCTKYIPELERAVPPCLPFIMPAGPSFWQCLRLFPAIRKAAKDSRVVVGSLELQSIFWAALFGKGKAIGWLHKDLAGYFAQKTAWYARLYAVILGWAFARCVFITCVSQGVLESTCKLFPAAAAKLRLLYNPIDFKAIQAKAEDSLPERLAHCFAKPVILGVGRLAPEKAFHLLIQAHALLRAVGSDHHLCILGEGPERAALEQETQRLGVKDSIFLPGFTSNPYPCMRCAAVLGLSSFFEGFPTVIMEALALGLPVVAADCPHGPAEILGDDQYGKLTPMNDPEALAEALGAMLAGEERKRYIQAGLVRVQDFSLENAVAAWEGILAEAAAGAE